MADKTRKRKNSSAEFKSADKPCSSYTDKSLCSLADPIEVCRNVSEEPKLTDNQRTIPLPWIDEKSINESKTGKKDAYKASTSGCRKKYVKKKIKRIIMYSSTDEDSDENFEKKPNPKLKKSYTSRLTRSKFGKVLSGNSSKNIDDVQINSSNVIKKSSVGCKIENLNELNSSNESGYSPKFAHTLSNSTEILYNDSEDLMVADNQNPIPLPWINEESKKSNDLQITDAVSSSDNLNMVGVDAGPSDMYKASTSGCQNKCVKKKKRSIIKYKSSSTEEEESDDNFEKNKLSDHPTSYIPRAAAVKATAAIAKHSTKHKRLKTCEHEMERRRKIVKECNGSDEDETDLEDYGILLNDVFINIYLEDEFLIVEDRCLVYLPAKPTVYNILCDYANKKSADLDVLNIVLDAFNQALAMWCLRRIEKLQYQEMVERFPGRPMFHIYGLPHFVRFILCLPKLFRIMEKDSPRFKGFIIDS
ncbi:uncharacterized protein LOC126836420 isoform X2 [Adelges cooleyi]|uniref:uncharacterized protein LOC126836420 isoform X2 n=1 Tax=Adelges cooleyi TaxID=133065 RepID=UPI00217F29D6|nr:uncharacterized protein LOC126836420 isoform X2 [Adelges cooleyi]